MTHFEERFSVALRLVKMYPRGKPARRNPVSQFLGQ